MEEARKKGWAIVTDGEHNFQGRYYYVDPIFQISQLAEAGFEVVAVYNKEGKSIDWRTPTDDNWLHYLCRPVHRSSAVV